MLSIQQVRELIGDPYLSDEEVARIRDACHALAELALEAAREQMRREQKDPRREPIQETLF